MAKLGGEVTGTFADGRAWCVRDARPRDARPLVRLLDEVADDLALDLRHEEESVRRAPGTHDAAPPVARGRLPGRDQERRHRLGRYRVDHLQHGARVARARVADADAASVGERRLGLPSQPGHGRASLPDGARDAPARACLCGTPGPAPSPAAPRATSRAAGRRVPRSPPAPRRAAPPAGGTASSSRSPSPRGDRTSPSRGHRPARRRSRP